MNAKIHFFARVSCGICALLLCSAAASPQTISSSPYELAAPTPDGTGKFYFHREIARMMGFEGATWLERKERAKKERPNLLIGDLHLKRGMTIADIGAGSGYYSRRMAPLIAPGKVLAVEIQPEMVDLLRKLAAKPGLGNIVPILGSQENVNLAEGSVDLAVMVDVYHEVSFPHEVISSIISALKPKGRLVFVEYRGEDPAVQISPVHKMTVKQILLEMDQFPLVLERRDERLPLQHIVIFRRQ